MFQWASPHANLDRYIPADRASDLKKQPIFVIQFVWLKNVSSVIVRIWLQVKDQNK